MLPENNTLPIRNYKAKKVLCPMGLEYQKIHACPNDCVLYRDEFASLKACQPCGLSRFKKKIDVYDSYSQEFFCLRAMLFCTLNDFPAYGNLSGYNVKGHFACPICKKSTSYICKTRET